MRILLINGPNLNTLGQREPEIYGHETLDDVVGRVEKRASEAGASVLAFQSNHEGALIDFIQAHQDEADALIINPGSLGHTSIGLRDAIAASGLSAVEVHISNVYARERFRQTLLLSAVCKGVITGLGWRGYLAALDYLLASSQSEE
jgi:3-dehydroquinate dehydratase-2